METPDTSDARLVNLNARIPRRVWRELKIAVEQGGLMQDFIREAVEEHLARGRGKRGARQ